MPTVCCVLNVLQVKKVSIDFEPFKPINTSLYLCDNKFHTEALADLLQARYLSLDDHAKEEEVLGITRFPCS